MTLGQMYREITAALLPQYAGGEAQAAARALLVHFTPCSRTQVYAFPEMVLPAAAVQRVRAALPELAAGKPLQYITGETDFCGCSIAVNGAVLIPRPETEELVAWAAQSVTAASPVVVDLCTGSGCLAVALGKRLPQAVLYAGDISQAALAVARQNAVRNNVPVYFFPCDLLSPPPAGFPFPPAACIISNPPYVRQSEAAHMSRRVLDYEPHEALFVPDDDPLVFYRAIAAVARQHLQPHGCVLVEINEALGDATRAVFAAAGLAAAELRKDLCGKERMLRAVQPLP